MEILSLNIWFGLFLFSIGFIAGTYITLLFVDTVEQTFNNTIKRIKTKHGQTDIDLTGLEPEPEIKNLSRIRKFFNRRKMIKKLKKSVK